MIIYEKVSIFRYLGATLSIKNNCSNEISIQLNEVQITFYALRKFFKF